MPATLRPLSHECKLPLVLEAGHEAELLVEVLIKMKEQLERELLSSGGILFRGYQIGGADGFRSLVNAFGGRLLSYEYASTPRTHIADNVYTSTEYPASQHIPLHNEQSYTHEWPMKLWLSCMIPAASGGETPIADSREIYRQIPTWIRERFTDRKLMYVRNYGNGLDLPWQKAFGFTDRIEVEAYCRRKGIDFEWREDGELRTRQICEAVARHPITGDMVWFNQAHLFHVSNLEPEIREALLESVEQEDLPRNTYYADGGEIDIEALEEIRSVLKAATLTFDWRRDDVLLIDNMLSAHGRRPYTGPRKVLVAMTEPHSSS